MIDKGTFGNTPAAIKLAEIINERNIPYRRIGNLLGTFNTILNEMSNVHSKVSITVVKIIRDKFLLDADKFPLEVRSYVKNLIIGKYRHWMVNNEGGVSRFKRKEFKHLIL